MEIVLALVPPHVSRYTSNIFKSHFSLPPIGGCYGSDHSKDLFAPPTIVWVESLAVVGPLVPGASVCMYVIPAQEGGTWPHGCPPGQRQSFPRTTKQIRL